MNRLVMVLSLALCVMVTGCRIPIQPIPGPGREGMLYCYTADYHDRHIPFCLLGKSLTASKGNGAWEMIPPPTALFPGLPLVLVERFAICPIVDTAFIPYDLCVKFRNEYCAAKDGAWIKIVDHEGHPVPDVEIDISINANSGYRIVYDGEVQERGYLASYVKTDCNGKAYVPIKFSSCGDVRFSGWCVTSKGLEEFDGSLQGGGGWARIGSDEIRHGRWGKSSMPDDWLRRWSSYAICRNCGRHVEIRGDRGLWNEDGSCGNCGKRLDQREALNRARAIKRDMKTLPNTKSEYRILNALTGLSVSRIEEIYGKCPDDGTEKMMIVRLHGIANDATKTEIAGLSFAKGTSPSEYLKNHHRTIGGNVMYQWHTVDLPRKPADFDSYWKSKQNEMRRDWHGDPEVTEIVELSTPSVMVSRVTFKIGERRVCGVLSEPRGILHPETPVLAFFGRGPDPDAKSLPKPSDRTVLYLSVFEPDYDYRKGEYDIREKYRLSQWAVLEGYSIVGIESGRESYFFYPVLSGAVWATEWLARRTSHLNGVCCVGVDQGAALALMTAALGGKVQAIRAYHPEFVGVAEYPNTWPPFHWHNRSGLMREAEKWMPYYELCSFARRVRCPVTLYLNPRETHDWRKHDASVSVFKALKNDTNSRLIVDGSISCSTALNWLVTVSTTPHEEMKEKR